MKTQDDLIQRIVDLQLNKEKDSFGYKTEILVSFLTRESVDKIVEQSSCVEGEQLTEWSHRNLDEETINSILEDTVRDAWISAHDKTGSTSFRLITEIEVLLWILEDEESRSVVLDMTNYAPYGVPILEHICKKYNFDEWHFGLGDTCGSA